MTFNAHEQLRLLAQLNAGLVADCNPDLDASKYIGRKAGEYMRLALRGY